jgi:hypothetical protein
MICKTNKKEISKTLYHIERCSFTKTHDLSALNPIYY